MAILIIKKKFVFHSPLSSSIRFFKTWCLIGPSCVLSAPWLDTMPHDRYNHLTLSGDVLSSALPGLAVVSSYYGSEPLLTQRACLVTGGVAVSTDIFKRLFNYTPLGERPNGYHSSFPSGHSSSAFLGARLIHRQWGIEYGAPAYALATLTAYSRVQGHYHHVRDVCAGAALAFAIDYFVDIGIEQSWIQPVFGSHGSGAGLGIQWDF